MADEGSFLKAILASPADDLPRLVYADFLDEQGNEEASRKAEFLRLTAANRTERRKQVSDTNFKRIRELARHLPTDWLPIVSRLKIENCETAGNAIRRPLQTVEFEFECPKQWAQLKPTDDLTVRYCVACRQNVYYCDTIVEARRHATSGHCVAVGRAVSRWPNDLRERPLAIGKMLPNSHVPQQQEQRDGAPAEEGE